MELENRLNSGMNRKLFWMMSLRYAAHISALLVLKRANLTASTSEAMRLIEGGGVRVDGAVVSDRGLRLPAGTFVVQVGKRKFARVTLS